METSIVKEKIVQTNWFVDVTAENFFDLTNEEWITAFRALKQQSQPNTSRVNGAALKWLIARKEGSIIEQDYNALKAVLWELANSDQVDIHTKNRYYASIRRFYQFVEARAKSMGIDFKSPFVERIDLPDFVQGPSRRKVGSPLRGQFLTIPQVEQALNISKRKGYQRYCAIALLVHSGARPSEIISIHRDHIDLKRRFFHTGYEVGCSKSNKSKSLDTGLVFIIPRQLIPTLELYLTWRDETYPDSEWLFPSPSNPSKFASINWLNNVTQKNTYVNLVKREVNPKFTLYWFRKSLDTHRKERGCPDNVNHHLMNHKMSDVEFQSYDQFDLQQLTKWFDENHPYKF